MSQDRAPRNAIPVPPGGGNWNAQKASEGPLTESPCGLHHAAMASLPHPRTRLSRQPSAKVLPRGVYSATFTPLDRNYRVNHKTLRQLVECQLKAGLTGFYLTGSTGQGFLLSEEDRKALVETVVATSRGRGKVIVHVGHMNSRVAADLAAHAERSGADAVSSVPPVFFKVGAAGALLHYQTIARATRLPLLGYNIPALADGLSNDLVGKLIQLPNWGGFKLTSFNLYQMGLWIEAMRKNQVMMIGCDEMMLPALAMGADGAIGTSENWFPREFVSILRDFDAGRLDLARKTQMRMNRVIHGVLALEELGVYKYLMELLHDLDLGPSPNPVAPPTSRAKAACRQLLRREGFI